MRLFSLSLITLLPLVASHFTLDYPTSRGFDEDIEDQAPCGGFPDLKTRSDWNFQQGKVQIDSHHDTATVNIYIAYTQDASNLTLSEFTTSSFGDQLQKELSIKGQGEFCFTNNVTAANSSAAAGQQATIMVEHISVHGHLYQCADVTFSNDTFLGSNITCTNALTAAGAASSSDGDSDAARSLTVGGIGLIIMAVASIAAVVL